MIDKRQKLIKIADRNKDGWQVVNEYETDDLAMGFEDERKSKKAKEVVNRKRKAKQNTRQHHEKTAEDLLAVFTCLPW